jgi:hypothetical protein
MNCTFRIARPGEGDVAVTLEIFQDEDGSMICGLRQLEGRITLGPKAMRAAMLTELAKIEDIARQAGCTEMRHAGEDRAWCLPGYEPMDGLRNGRRKRL